MLGLIAGQDPRPIAKGGVLVVGIGVRAGQGRGIQRLFDLGKAGVTVMMFKHLQLFADEIAVFIKAGTVMGMQGDLRLAADKVPIRVIAGFVMGMQFNFGQCADQAAVLIIAVFVMGMHDKIRIPAHKLAVLVVAVRRMLVDLQRFRIADQRRFGDGGQLRVAVRSVGVFLHAADRVFFQRDARQNERIGRDEHDHSRQRRDDFSPASFAAVLTLKQLCQLLCNILHFTLTLPSILERRKISAARRGTQSCQRPVHPPHIRLTCCGSPPK